MYGRYEYSDERSHKFWTCEPIGNGEVRISWGRIGTEGQSHVKSEGEGLNKIREKLAKGYQLVQDAVVSHETKRRKAEIVVDEALRSVTMISESDELDTPFLRELRKVR